MISNLEKYKKDLDRLINDGEMLQDGLHFECFPDDVEKELKKIAKSDSEAEKIKKAFPVFNNKYQAWYSEALSMVTLLLPNRLDDFVRLYAKPKSRKEITYENYTIEDALQGLHITRTVGYETKKIVGKDAATPRFQQQLNILKSAQGRFESSLFDIKQLLQADLFDSELDAAKELNKKGFTRGAGAVAGVVLEGHLAQVCENHKLAATKKNPTISDFNDLLKSNNVVETSAWRFIQHLGDLRNKCDHQKGNDPSEEEIGEFIEGVEKISKSLF